MEPPLPDRTPGLAYATKLRWVRSSISSTGAFPQGIAGCCVMLHGPRHGTGLQQVSAGVALVAGSCS